MIAALIALALDAAIGWPQALYSRIKHPVVWIGRLIDVLERRWNHGPAQRAKGTALVVVVLAAAVIPATLVQAVLPGGLAGMLLAGVIGWPLIAARSLHDHVAAVARPLMAGNLPAARAAVAMIVGRDVSRADSPAISRAALESLAENASDGVFAPLFWFAVAGLPGLAGYKALNTMDSMIGHRNARYEQFGKVAARLDDLANLIPARLSALIFALASGRQAVPVLRLTWREARQHRSPNAGWPEAAMAGALHIRLSGPRHYGDRLADEPYVNATAPDPTPADLDCGLALFRRACLVAAALLTIAALWRI
ncbi:MAG: adenosylcobinamide-phosphate synthase CbiB [Paracoccus sp. (in: a-proteobacteria)]|uniref:adenosylcobinamide-phosphate synthase CbiB n=1 Tax=Paracoccus sp. TaxID=267 RepID=UPI0026E1079D|nr:adenosylcobinamide-phosphate synthase CbiB [Paracoccus sp. (in: a-proteobacteria)]MDO5621978.1 adenosylcobinamide-phosphate synthase CbiB [Paracoccus sp. (in: a-proteobacteria)]